MFTSHNSALKEQRQRILECLEKHVAQFDAKDPEFARLKEAERVAASKVNSSLPDDEAAKHMQAHDHAVMTLVRYISSK